MLQAATRTPNVSIAESGPSGLVQQTIQCAFAFAEANDSTSIDQLLATIAIASDGAGRGADLVQSAIPAGSVVRVAARQPGGLVMFGPIVARRSRDGDPPGEPVAARMMVRCTVIQSHGL